MVLEAGLSMARRQQVAVAALAALLLTVALIELGLSAPRFLQGAGREGDEGREYPQFLVVGDWGREGQYNQTVVAAAMTRKAAAMERLDFVISTGDNFYNSGLTSPEDPSFSKSFTDIYTEPSLQVPWHVVLGNHDYGETKSTWRKPCPEINSSCYLSPIHQLDVRLTQRDPRWHCERSFRLSLAGGQVETFFLDTSPLIAEYYDYEWAGNRGGVLQQSWEDTLRELEAALARSEADWKLVVGHHPIRSNHREDLLFPEMVQHVEPLLIRHGVQAYFNGHDHNLQHLHSPQRGYHQIVSGAGSKVGPEFYGQLDSPFQYGGNGFVAVRIGRDSMTVEYLGVDSEQPLFSIDIPRLVPPPAAH